MRTLRIIKDEDVGSREPRPEKFEERKASRGVIFDENKNVAVIYSAKNKYHKLPGGGVEADEDFETALKREVTEEIGCKIDNVREIGIIEEYRNEGGLHQSSYGFTANVLEKGLPTLQDYEIEQECTTKWLNLDIAIKTIEDEGLTEHYHGKFMQIRDLTFLKESKKLIK